MFDEGKLWKDRFSRTSKELSRYLRYIFNGHLVIVLLFLLGAVAFYYQEYVKTLSSDFPAALIMAVILGVFLTHSPIYTFLLEADRVFLLPLETKLSGYFKKSMVVSFFLQAYLLLMVLAVFMPMYVHVYEGAYKSIFAFLLAVALMKIWNLLARWQIQYFVNTNTHLIDSIVRYILNGMFLYFMFTNQIIFMGISVLLMIILYSFYRKQTEDMGLKWEYLIDLEEKRMTTFYRVANLFTDVPKFKDRVKRRRWLDWLLSWIKFRSENTFLYLYLHAFLRAGDYFGLVIRLTVIGAIALYLISFGFGQIILVLVFIYLTAFQLLPLANHHQNKMWVSLYPLKEEGRKQSFRKLLMAVLLIQGFVLSFVLLIKGEVLVSLTAFASAVVFSGYFVFGYSKKRLIFS